MPGGELRDGWLGPLRFAGYEGGFGLLRCEVGRRVGVIIITGCIWRGAYVAIGMWAGCFCHFENLDELTSGGVRGRSLGLRVRKRREALRERRWDLGMGWTVLDSVQAA